MFVSTRTNNLAYHRYVAEMAALRSVSPLTDVCVAVYYLFTLTVCVNDSLKLAISQLFTVEKDKKLLKLAGVYRQHRGGKTMHGDVERTINQTPFGKM